MHGQRNIKKNETGLLTVYVMTPCGLVDYVPVQGVPEHGRCRGMSEVTRVSKAIQLC
jgi:hypothetical protein